jgi:ATP-binding cassette subfamily C protein LapB
LRDNLLIGIADPGDSAILQAANKTGLIQVVRSHPQGLDLPISEGGVGLSGGQRQLVNLTRLVLREPSIWLLDEPTASMDQASEAHCMKMFETALGDEDTLVLVTHKPELLKLVNRLIVIANHQIVLDGEKNSVLAALQRADLLTPAQGPVQALEEGEHV